MAGFLGGLFDDAIRLAVDITITIPSLLVLIVIQAVLGRVDLLTMALLISLFSWATPTALSAPRCSACAKAATCRWRVSPGVPVRDIMFKEIMPNLLPYLGASYIGNMQGAIISAVGLEVLGFGPQRIPSLGVAIFFPLKPALYSAICGGGGASRR